MLPEGWAHTTVAEACETVSVGIVVNPSSYYVSESDGVRAFRSGNVRENAINDSNWVFLSEEGNRRNKKSVLRTGDVLVVRTGFAGTACVVPAEYDGANCIDILFARPKRKYLLPEYLSQLTNSELGRKQVFAGQSGLAQKHLNVASYAKMRFGLPPVAEQARVAEMLSTWDQSIATTERLIGNNRSLRQSLANELLSGRKRFQVQHPWRAKPISDLIDESRIAGSGGDEARKLTVKLYAKGVVAKPDKREGSGATQYYRRSAGQFIYSKLDFLNGAFGLIPDDLDGYESTLDLPAFDFRPGVNPRWFLHFVSRKTFYRGQLGLANGGRKARRVNPADLLKVSINVPRIDEQNLIAEAIDHADRIVRAEENKLAMLRAEKAALMQQLLTGKRRVRVAAPEAEAEPA